MSFVPYVVEQSAHGERSYDIFSRLLNDRIIVLSEDVNDTSASLVVAQLLYLEGQDLSGGCGGSALRGRRCRNAFLLPELLAEPVFRAGCRRSSAPVPNGISHCGRCADGSAVPGAFCPWAAAHLPFYDAVWDRFRIAFVRIAFRFEPTDNICAALRLRYPCIPCGRNVVHVRRIRTAGKRKALFSRLRAWRTGPQHRLAFGSVCPDAVSAPAALRCGSGDAVSGRAGKTYLS